MPQPINRIVREPRIILDTDVLAEKPDMAILIVHIFAIWAAIERRLSVLLVRLLGADAVPAHAIFSILQTQALQTKALEAAAKSSLSPADFDIFSACLAVSNSVQKTRNRLAHWAWGKCTQRPDLLILGDPDGFKERDTRVAAYYQSAGPDANSLAAAYVSQFDLSKFFAYSKTDLEREVRDLLEADEIMFHYGIHLDPSFSTVAAKLLNEPSAPEQIRAEALQQLNGKRLFREALAQIWPVGKALLKRLMDRIHKSLSGGNNLGRASPANLRDGRSFYILFLLCQGYNPYRTTVSPAEEVVVPHTKTSAQRGQRLPLELKWIPSIRVC